MIRARVRFRVLCGLAVAGLVAAMTPGCGGGSNTYNPALIGGNTASFGVTVAPASVTVTAGQSATYTVTVTASNGFSNAVALSVSGLPAGAAGTFSPASVTPTAQGATSTLTVTTTAAGGQTVATAPGTYSLTISGTDGSITRSTAASLVVTGPGSLTGTIQ